MLATVTLFQSGWLELPPPVWQPVQPAKTPVTVENVVPLLGVTVKVLVVELELSAASVTSNLTVYEPVAFTVSVLVAAPVVMEAG